MWSGGSSCFLFQPWGIMQIGYLGMGCWSHQCWKLITTEEKPRAPGIVPLQFHRWRLRLKSLICWVRARNSKMAHEASNSRSDIHPLQFSFEILYLCKHLLPFQKRTAACHPIQGDLQGIRPEDEILPHSCQSKRCPLCSILWGDRSLLNWCEKSWGTQLLLGGKVLKILKPLGITYICSPKKMK